MRECFIIFLLLESFSCNTVSPRPKSNLSEVEQQVDPLPCGAEDRLRMGEFTMIESQNYPSQYPNKHECKWTIKVPKNSDVIFSCDFFDLKKGDFLSVGDYMLGGYYDAPFGFRMAMSKKKLKLKFKTNKKTTGGGFR